MVTLLFGGQVRPLLRTAERTRSLDSWTAVSGRPTTTVPGNWEREISTSTSTSSPSRPTTAQLSTRASTPGLCEELPEGVNARMAQAAVRVAEANRPEVAERARRTPGPSPRVCRSCWTLATSTSRAPGSSR